MLCARFRKIAFIHLKKILFEVVSMKGLFFFIRAEEKNDILTLKTEATSVFTRNNRWSHVFLLADNKYVRTLCLSGM